EGDERVERREPPRLIPRGRLEGRLELGAARGTPRARRVVVSATDGAHDVLLGHVESGGIVSRIIEAARKHELQLEGLAGPTHRFSGLGEGNRASIAHRGEPSSPRSAALASVAKMRRLLALGVPVALLPPEPRPHFELLRRLGFGGTEREILEAASRRAPDLLEAASSSAFMWAANAATVSPSADTEDGRLHATPANRLHNLHRSIEAEGTERSLRALFAGHPRFVVHRPLPAHPRFADEGAANHTRLVTEEGPLHLFVHGTPGEPAPRR